MTNLTTTNVATINGQDLGKKATRIWDGHMIEMGIEWEEGHDIATIYFKEPLDEGYKSSIVSISNLKKMLEAVKA